MATGELARAFRAAGIRWVLLKGPAIADRLYQGRVRRPYNDVDALVGPRDYVRAEEVLTELGYERVPDSTRRDVEHASPWRRTGGGEIDLHRSFAHIPASRDSVWEALHSEIVTIEVARENVDVPSEGALALIVALHALHHAGQVPQPLADLERALGQLAPEDWERARSLASALGADRNLAAALSLSDRGAVVRARLGLPKVARWEVALRSGSRARLGAAMAALRHSRGIRQKTRALYRELVPEKPTVEAELRLRYMTSSTVLIRAQRILLAIGKLPIATLAWWVQRKDMSPPSARR